MNDETSSDQPGGAADERSAIDSLADDVLPALIARLRASRLGELEIRSGGWRVRLRREASDPPIVSTSDAAGSRVPAESAFMPDVLVAHSPAVGYFSPRSGTTPGASVRAGDVLGSVDVLGVMQEVTAPSDGIVSELHATVGEAVEFGQPLVGLAPAGASTAGGDAADTAD